MSCNLIASEITVEEEESHLSGEVLNVCSRTDTLDVTILYRCSCHCVPSCVSGPPGPDEGCVMPQSKAVKPL